MKVLMINEGALSDYEVFELMKERKDSRLHKSANVAYAERNWMDHKVLKFLSQTHSKCSQLDAEKIKHFLREIEKAAIHLTPAEKLQFINHVPVELVDVHLIVEDCAGRFSETQIEELIQIVEQTLAAKQDEGDATNTDESAE
ncbi:Calcitonin gene-related peptide-receptor component protein, partial [Globisporangium splendens]